MTVIRGVTLMSFVFSSYRRHVGGILCCSKSNVEKLRMRMFANC